MAVNTKITKARLRQHWQYSAWKYVLLLVVCVFAWNLIYSVTRYRPPADKRVHLYIQSAADITPLNEHLNAFREASLPECEEMYAVAIMDSDEMGGTQLYTYTASGEGDIYILHTKDFKTYAEFGLFQDLTPYIESGELNLGEQNLQAGRYTYTDEQTDGTIVATDGQYGLPLDKLYGLMDMAIDNRDLMLGVTVFSGNLPGALAVINDLYSTYTAPEPAWLTQTAAPSAAPALTEAPAPTATPAP